MCSLELRQQLLCLPQKPSKAGRCLGGMMYFQASRREVRERGRENPTDTVRIAGAGGLAESGLAVWAMGLL